MRTVAYCGDYTALTTTKWGAKIYVDTRDTSLAPHIMLEGDWEPWVTNCMEVLLEKHKGCTFIDVGANVGWYTLLACVRGAGHVFAFEPNPRMVELLRKTIAVNGYYKDRVTLTAAACGAHPGTMELVVDPVEAGGAHVVPLRWQPPAACDDACKVVCLDDVVLPKGMMTTDATPQVLIKVDVEGFEPEVLAGATKLMQYSPILFLEHARSDRHRDMYGLLANGFGYILRHVQHTGHQSHPLTIDEVMALGSAETVLCLPPGES